jgi:antitoxin (DNA-binding transcriptional repressor) of toxin-antitoxin stability system
VDVRNEELYTIREAMRELHKIVRQLETGELEQAVLMRNNQMVAVIVPLERAQDESSRDQQSEY